MGRVLVELDVVLLLVEGERLGGIELDLGAILVGLLIKVVNATMDEMVSFLDSPSERSPAG